MKNNAKQQAEVKILCHYSALDGVAAVARVDMAHFAAADRLTMLVVCDQDAKELWQEADEFFENNFSYFRSFKEKNDFGALEYDMMLDNFLSLQVVFTSAADLDQRDACPPGVTLTYLFTQPDFKPATPPASKKQNITRDLITLQDRFWQNLVHILAAAQGGKRLIALKELELARETLVRIKCKSLEADWRHWRGTSTFDQDFEKRLLSTFPRAFSQADLITACDNLFNLFISMLRNEQITLHADEYEDFYKELKQHLFKI